ncbi:MULTISPECIES: acylneuraminate cytidylyltransferase family protein [Thalassospira]|uniref:Acylneuraminate cytidylyltransferase family protein n=1 Tax=Thalassospira lohafexi TaxID=744227 RepID=A0A2N3LBE7_9PROT|nr:MULTISPECIES: acylneuraminate cytidylyltransferase family protein [Thalassospira]PKR60057.1 acylneuraminate cytidylyltransferase family protein [Thalassospira lohafexi]RCK30563.1 hypothetical protein TH1_01150 [Thalassospira lucentensis MCCC 1A00383 = DSM 14000]
MSCLAIIPARGGSKGVPGKNKLPIGGVPLIQRAIRACLDSGVVDQIFVSTDDAEIAELAFDMGVKVRNLRPKELSDDHADIIPVIQHALAEAEQETGRNFERLLFTDPTTPFRTADTIRRAVHQFETGSYGSIISVCPLERKPNNIFTKRKDGTLDRLLKGEGYEFIRRQDMRNLCRLANAVYVTSVENFLENLSLVSGPIGYVEVSNIEAITIDEELDYFLAEQVSLRYGG